MKTFVKNKWVSTEIGQIADIITGRTPSTKRPEFYGGKIPFVKPGDLDGPVRLVKAEATVTEAGAAEGRLLPEGTVLVSCIGNLGKIAILDVSAITNQQINAVLAPAGVEPMFIYYWARTIRPWMEKNASATTVTILNKGRFAKAPFPLPPFNEQRRIVAKLEALQQRTRRARTALDAIPPLLEKYRQSVLAAAFRGDLTADWRAQNPDVEPASVLLERIREERRRRWEEAELAKMEAKGKVPSNDRWKKRYKQPHLVDCRDLSSIPPSWSWVGLDEISWDSGYGTSVKCTETGDGLPVLRIPNVVQGEIDLEKLKFATSDYQISEGEALNKNDFLIVRTNGSRDLIGRGALVSDTSSAGMSFASYLIRYRLLGGPELGRWLSYVWQSPYVRARLVQLAATSAGQYNVSLTKLSEVPVPLPPLQELPAVNSRVSQSLGHCPVVSSKHGEISSSLGALDQSLLAKAFRGELVPQDPNDEPASVLLERIRATRSEKPTKKRRGPKKAAKKSLRHARNYTGDDWRHALLACLGDDDAEIEDAIEAAAIWAAENQGLEFQRLRRDGLIVRGLEAALERAVRAGEVERVGPSTIRKA